MDRDQVLEAIQDASDKWWNHRDNIEYNMPLNDLITDTVMRLDKPPTVTRKAILDWRDETWKELRDDFNSDADAVVNQMFLATQMAEFLTAQGVNVED